MPRLSACVALAIGLLLVFIAAVPLAGCKSDASTGDKVEQSAEEAKPVGQKIGEKAEQLGDEAVELGKEAVRKGDELIDQGREAIKGTSD